MPVRRGASDANSFEPADKAGGQGTQRVLSGIGEDGWTSRTTVWAQDADGQEISSIFIYDRQE